MGGAMRRVVSLFIFLLLALDLFITHIDRVEADVRSYDLTNAVVLLNTTYSQVVSLPGQRLLGVVKPASWIIPQDLAQWCYVDKDICFIYTIRNLFYIIAVSKTLPRNISVVYSLNLNTILPSAHAIPTSGNSITASYIVATPFRDESNRTIYALIVLSVTATLAGSGYIPGYYSTASTSVSNVIFRFIPFVFSDNSIRFITSMVATYQDTRSITVYTLTHTDGRGASILFFSLVSAAVNEYSDFVVKYVLISSDYDTRMNENCPVIYGSDQIYCQSVSFIFNAAVISQINASSAFIVVNPGPAMSGPNPGGYRFNGVLPVSFLLTDRLQAGFILMSPKGFTYAVIYNDITSGYQLYVFGPWPYRSLSNLQFYTPNQDLCLYNRLMFQYTINSPPQFYLSYSERRPNSATGDPGMLTAIFLVPEMQYSHYAIDYYATQINAQAYNIYGSVSDSPFSDPSISRYYIYRIGNDSRKLCKAQYYDYFREFGYDWLYAPGQDIYAPQLILMVWNSDRSSNNAYLYNFKMPASQFTPNPQGLINVVAWGPDYIVVDNNGAIVLLTMQPVQQVQRTDTPAQIQPPGSGGNIPTLTVTAPPAPGAPPGSGSGPVPGGPGWVYDPNFWNILIFFAIMLLPLLLLADRLGMPGALIGSGLGLALGVYIGVVPFWLIIILALGMLIFLVFGRGGGGKE
jgi:hypothetical protein